MMFEAHSETGVLTRYTVKVDAPASELWNVLVDKVTRPQLYMPDVLSVEIRKQFSPYSVERSVRVGDNKTVNELVTANVLTKTVLFKIQDDAFFRGFVTQSIYEEGGQTFLEYVMNWSGKGCNAPDLHNGVVTEVIKNVVENTKRITEERHLQKEQQMEDMTPLRLVVDDE